MLCALIMAGGKGTRFWPLSTEEKPKQFLNLIDSETMIQKTVNRIQTIIPIERVFVCTASRYVRLVKEQLPNLPEKNIIVEPEGRNTAPCIALSALIIKKYYKNASMVVLPSDHLIRMEKEFTKLIELGNEFIQNNENAIITLGMKPSRPETGYGYIKVDNLKNNNMSIYPVSSFVEKPNLEKAEKYIKEGIYLWNGGMFIWRVNSIIEKIKNYMPDTYEALKDIESIPESEFLEYINENYAKTEEISIDYGVLEKDDNIFVIPAEIGWDDIGSWNSLERYKERDNNNNIVTDNVIISNSNNNLIVGGKKKIILSGLKDIYVIESDDVILIGNRNNINEIKSLKEKLI